MGGMTCDHEWVPRMLTNERGMLVFDTRPHFENVPNSKRRHLDVMYRVCPKCQWVGFRYAHSRVIYTWNPDDEKNPAQQ